MARQQTVDTGGRLLVAPEVFQAAADDFKRFLDFEAQHRGYKVPPFHFVIADFLQGRGHPSWVNTTKLLRGFRLAAKSYIVRCFARFRQMRVPATQVIIHSSSQDNAEKFVRAYYDELLSSPLTAHMAPPPGASQLAFNLRGVKPEVGWSVQGAGIATSLTGSRADLYIPDDPEPDTDPEGDYDRIMRMFMEARHILHSPYRHLRSMKIAQQPQLKGYREDELLRLPGFSPEVTQMIVVGQPHWTGSVYILPGESDTIDMGEDGGHPLMNAAVLDVPAVDSRTGDWLWPEIMHEKFYDHQRVRPMTVSEVRQLFTARDAESWELQMMLNYRWNAGAGAVLHLDQIEQGMKIIPEPILVLDPADSEAGCEHGIVILGMAETKIHIAYMGGMRGECYEGDWEDGTLLTSVWRHIFDIADEFGCGRVLIEKNLKSARAACRRYLMKSGRRYSVEEFSAVGLKARRICNALAAPWNSGMLSCDPQVMRDPKNTRQFLKLRWDKAPEPSDRIDALASGVAWLIENRGEVSSPLRMQDYLAMRRPQPLRPGVNSVGPLARMGR